MTRFWKYCKRCWYMGTYGAHLTWWQEVCASIHQLRIDISSH